MLNPWYVTGLCEGEASFSVSFNLRNKLNVGIETKPSFSITLNRRDLELIKEIYKFFGCGGIRYSRPDRCYKYEVRSVNDLVEKIIPHFEEYPLQGAKKRDFELFKKICLMVRANLHLSFKYLPEIIDFAYQMNESGRRRYTKEDLLRVLGGVKG
ncbi:endonuclease [Caldimicrobium thiodismutans]|uniref:Endonuclease n=1 Tax=Caldimicrobium thiodismutans TaxID=1653476 RepID=A0A0U5AHX0_9BACT|nr:endonuclease [Caldimicrobium thiodismutans]